MCKNQIGTNPKIIALQEEWLRGKDAETQWKEYRLNIEEQILAALGEAGIKLPDIGTSCLEELNITKAEERKWNGPALTDLALNHPNVVGTLLKVEYVSALTKANVNDLVESESEIGQELAKCFTDKPRKAGFRAKA